MLIRRQKELSEFMSIAPDEHKIHSNAAYDEFQKMDVKMAESVSTLRTYFSTCRFKWTGRCHKPRCTLRLIKALTCIMLMQA